jgi:APA family basic amino acid/polyamine antiporter
MSSSLFVRKRLDTLIAETSEDGAGTLRRTLGPVNLVSLGIGAIIGAGIFVITGTAAAQFAGPAIVLSFLFAGAGCVFAGLCYAEFASLIPIAGSAYTYGYATLGELVAWIIGWDLILEYAVGAATVASGWSGNIVSLLHDLKVPVLPQLIGSPGTEFVYWHDRWQVAASVTQALHSAGVDASRLPHAVGVFDLPAFLVIAGVTAILIVGIRESATFNALIVAVKVGTVLVFIAVAGVFVARHPSLAWANWHPFIPPNRGAFGEFGWSGVARGAGVIFFAFIGFDAVSTAAQEARRPQRDMPIGILGSLVICTVLYVLMGGLLTGIVKYTQLNVAAPIALGIDATGVGWGSVLVKVGTFAGLSTTMLVMLLGQSRVLFTMSRDGLLPAWCSRVHPRFRTPWISSAVVGLCVGVFAGLVPISTLGQLTSIGTLLAFVIVCAGVWVLRRRRPELERPFKAPFVPLVPILGIVISLGLMASLPFDTWIRLVAWLAIGLAIYFSFSRHHSLARRGAEPERGSQAEGRTSPRAEAPPSPSAP